MATIAEISKAAFDGVSAAISGAVKSASLTDGTTVYSGRVVLGGETAPTGFPMAKAKEKVRPAYLEGFSAVAAAGWTFTADSVVYYVLSVRDIVDASGFQVINAIASTDMLWKTATFQSVMELTDDLGGKSRQWQTLSNGADVSVGLVAMSGQERWQSERLEVQSQWRMICPPVEGLNERDRVIIGSRVYNITFVDDVEQRGVWHVIDLSLGAAV